MLLELRQVLVVRLQVQMVVLLRLLVVLFQVQPLVFLRLVQEC